MKRLILIAAAAGLLLLVFSFNPGTANACYRWGCADPQLCINSELLNVLPTATSDTFVTVPEDATVDFNVANCGGTGVPVKPSNVLTGGNRIVVTVLTEPGAEVNASYGDQSFTKSSRLGVDVFKFNLP